jgi:hypothetical protein
LNQLAGKRSRLIYGVTLPLAIFVGYLLGVDLAGGDPGAHVHLVHSHSAAVAPLVVDF